MEPQDFTCGLWILFYFSPATNGTREEGKTIMEASLEIILAEIKQKHPKYTKTQHIQTKEIRLHCFVSLKQT